MDFGTVLAGIVIVSLFIAKWMVLTWIFQLIIGALQGLSRIGTEKDTTEIKVNIVENKEKEEDREYTEEEVQTAVNVLNQALDEVERSDNGKVVDFTARRKIRDARNSLDLIVK